MNKMIFIPKKVNGKAVENELKKFELFCENQDDFMGCGFGAGVIALFREWEKYKKFYMDNNQEEYAAQFKRDQIKKEAAEIKKAELAKRKNAQ